MNNWCIGTCYNEYKMIIKVANVKENCLTWVKIGIEKFKNVR
jgi:hypothetical protein